jgi:hypothetical protein
MAKYRIEERPEWRWWVTPKPLKEKPVHRWCVFPHSFTSELVLGLIDEWGLTAKDRILDPFCGAGTTPLAAKERGISSEGIDLSPYAAFVSSVKLNDYNSACLARTWTHLQRRMDPDKWNGTTRDYPDLVKKALPGDLLGAFDSLAGDIHTLDCRPIERDFFKMALLTTLQDFSRAIPSGGWLEWRERHNNKRHIPARLAGHVEAMLSDLRIRAAQSAAGGWTIHCADARKLPQRCQTVSAVITSPPYPNRHDYTRVFGVELMFGFLDWNQTRHLRYQSFESHPEAKPERPPENGYLEPKELSRALALLEKAGPDPRIPPMLRGYFLDMFLSLRELHRVTQKESPIALVVGNAQYCGVSFMVDELTAEIGEQVGLRCERIIAARYRGNSAQQMALYGRHPSRESVVVFKRHQ